MSFLRSNLDLNYLKKVLEYNPETGLFTWLIKPRPRACSKTAGTLSAGYRQICIRQVTYRAHRLAWFYMTGEWPSSEIDHANGSKDDNRWSNLRLADKSKNAANSKLHYDSTTRCKGVTILSGTGRFQSRIQVEGRFICIGSFDTKKEASEAYIKAAQKYFGEFARVS